LPVQFVPLLEDTLERVKGAIQRVMPVEKKLTALEEAEFEDMGGEDGALEREMLSQGKPFASRKNLSLNVNCSHADIASL